MKNELQKNTLSKIQGLLTDPFGGKQESAPAPTRQHTKNDARLTLKVSSEFLILLETAQLELRKRTGNKVSMSDLIQIAAFDLLNNLDELEKKV